MSVMMEGRPCDDRVKWSKDQLRVLDGTVGLPGVEDQNTAEGDDG